MPPFFEYVDADGNPLEPIDIEAGNYTAELTGNARVEPNPPFLGNLILEMRLVPRA